MTASPRLALISATEQPYNPTKGWDTLAQPLSIITDNTLRPYDYYELGRLCVHHLHQEMENYCKRNGFTSVTLPYQSFRDDFENGTMNFREWFEWQCKIQGKSPNVDALLISAVKELASCERKERDIPADRIKDYARGMMVFLDGPTPKQHRTSVQNMERGIIAIETDELSVGRNNLYNIPKRHGYRGHKSAWPIIALQDPDWVLLCSVKIEHECQMDLDKLTRPFMNFGRNNKKTLGEYWEKAAKSERFKWDKGIAKTPKITHERGSAAEELSRKLYDYVFARGGLNFLLAHHKKIEHQPLPDEQLVSFVREKAHMPGVSTLAQKVISSGILPDSMGVRMRSLLNGPR